MKKEKIYIENLGCVKNYVDSERLIGAYLRNNYIYTNNPLKADIIIVNTCSFILPSREEAIDIIFDYAELKQHKLKKLIVTGCLVESHEDEIRKEFKEIDIIVNNRNLENLLKTLSLEKEKEEFYYFNRKLLNNNGYAYLKVSEGCNRKCSFCTIPLFKGKLISRNISSLITEAELLVDLGLKELILIAQDLTDYGKDINVSLLELLKKLIKIKNLKWIRLLYTYPTSINNELIDIITQSEKICSYIDVPLQHLDDDVLKKMDRQGNKKYYYDLIEKLRSKIPDIAIRSSFIVGFPGETETAFNNLYNSLKELKLDRVGVFTYSLEENTTSFKLLKQIPEKVKEERKRIIMELQEDISKEKLKNRVGKTCKVLVDEEVQIENNDNTYYLSRSEYEAPEVDGNIILNQPNLILGKMYNVKIIDSYEHDLLGEVIN